ncbi:MAG: helix-turn-helix domain-containing protein [Gelidibacter sp.]|nr:helix-turn-helix domain-containing protein [Gelidibacter sp.]
MENHNKEMEIYDPKNWLSTGQAASFLKLAPGTLQNWRSQGKGPYFIKRGNNVYYPKETLSSYLRKNAKLYHSTAQWREEL